MTKPIRRLIGMRQGKPVWAPQHAHGLILSAAGGGKTTTCILPTLFSLAADTDRALFAFDFKNLEIASMTAQMFANMGRKVGIIDHINTLGDHPLRISVNPLSGVIEAFGRKDKTFALELEKATLALIPEPENDQRNFYFRSEPRTLIQFAIYSLLVRNAKLATPGGVWSMITIPTMLLQAAEIEASEGSPGLKALAVHVLGMSQNTEHWPQHLAAAKTALSIFGADSPLHEAGLNATVTPTQLLTEKYILFMGSEMRYAERFGTVNALYLQSFMAAQTSHQRLTTTYLLDEFTNCPLKDIISLSTIVRSYGANFIAADQSFASIQKTFGEKAAIRFAENTIHREWLGFSSYEEADRVSQAMGETVALSNTLNTQSKGLGFSSALGMTKERYFPVDQLQRLPSHQKLVYMKDIGYFLCDKTPYNWLAPYNAYVGINPMEGKPLPPDTRLTLPVPHYPNQPNVFRGGSS